jgi:hypothetical protein
MTLRVTVVTKERSTIVQIDGRLSAPYVGELDRVLCAVEGPVVLELSNLRSADDTGVATLRLLARQGAELASVSPYMALLLRSDDTRTTSRKTSRAARRKPMNARMLSPPRRSQT